MAFYDTSLGKHFPLNHISQSQVRGFRPNSVNQVWNLSEYSYESKKTICLAARTWPHADLQITGKPGSARQEP